MARNQLKENTPSGSPQTRRGFVSLPGRFWPGTQPLIPPGRLLIVFELFGFDLALRGEDHDEACEPESPAYDRA